MRDSPLFDHNAFGGDGVPGTYSLPENFNTLVPQIVPINPDAFKGCVGDGPFASYKIPLGPGKLITKHCLVRNINDTYKQYLTSEAAHNTIKQPNFELFRIELEGRPVTSTPRMHDAAHVLVGGDMSNFYSSVAGEASHLAPYPISSWMCITDVHLMRQIPSFSCITRTSIGFGGSGSKWTP